MESDEVGGRSMKDRLRVVVVGLYTKWQKTVSQGSYSSSDTVT